MARITVSVPEKLNKDMKRLRTIDWSEVARKAFVKKIEQLEIIESFSKDSELTKEDALRLGRNVNKAVFKSIVAKSRLREKDASEIADRISKSVHAKYKKKFSHGM